MARSSSDGVAIRYVLPVLWMTSCFYTMSAVVRERNGINSNLNLFNDNEKTASTQYKYIVGCAQGAKSAIDDCLVCVSRSDVSVVFTPRLYASAVYRRVSVRPSVRSSDTSLHCTKETVKSMNTQTTLHNCLGTQLLTPNISAKSHQGYSQNPNGSAK